MAIDQILIEYDAKIEKLTAKLDQINAKMGSVEKQGKKATSAIETGFTNIGKTILNTAGILGTAAITQKIIDIGIESVKTAARAEGVEQAFRRLNNPKLLDDLRKATRGTVSDLQLMQTAIRAENFRIPLNELSRLLEFARRRAKETGEDVNFLVDSIVLGIGRKSPLILDNLGISAVELRQKLKGVGVEAATVGDISKVVGDIAQEALKKMGDETVTTGDKIDQLAAKFDNAGKKFGDILIGVFENITLGLEPFLALLKLNDAIDDTNEKQKDQIKAIKQLASIYGTQYKDALITTVLGVELLNDANEKLANDFIAAREAAKTFGNAIGDFFTQFEDGSFGLTEAGKSAIDTLNKLNETAAKPAVETLESLNAQLKEMQDELQKIPVGTAAFDILNRKIFDLQERIKELLLIVPREEILPNLKKDIKNTDDFTMSLEKANFQLAKARFLGTVFADSEGTFAPSEEDIKAWEDYELAVKDATINTFAEVAQAANQLLFNVLNANLEKQIQATQESADRQEEIITAQYDAELRKFQDLNAAKKISDEQLARQRDVIKLRSEQAQQRIQEEADKKTRELQRKQAINDKLGALFSIAINTAEAVVKLLETPPLAIAAGIAGAAQAALVAGTPIPAFKEGVIDFKGKGSETSDSNLVRISKGESVIPAVGTKKHRSFLEAIKDDNLDSYLMLDYIPRLMKKKGKDVQPDLADSIILNKLAGDNQDLISAISRNKKVSIDNTSQLASEIVRAMEINKQYSTWYG